jgi:hypothetical protein
MCCCGKPTINGQPNAYSWDGKTFSTRQPWPPALLEGDTLLWDEPGRCGGIDAHSHHYRLVKTRYGGLTLRVRHGGGEECTDLGYTARLVLPSLDVLDSDARYWLMHTLDAVREDTERAAVSRETTKWSKAAAEKRIKVRKVRGQNLARVTIEPPRVLQVAS